MKEKKLIPILIAVFILAQVFPPFSYKASAQESPALKTVENTIREDIPQNTNELIIKYKDDSKSNDALNIDKIEVGSSAELQKVIDKYSKNPSVDFVQPNYIYRATALNDSYRAYQWGLDVLELDAALPLNPSGGKGIKVAVLDTGIDLDHEDLSPNILGGYNALGGTGYDDDNGHGTHVAGIIGALDNNHVGVAGVAGGASLLAVKVLDKDGYGTSESISRGIIWAADNGAQIINMSLGTDQSDPLMKNAVDYAYSKGVVLVAAAGNEFSNKVLYPAAYDNVIAVSALNEANSLADFSNLGPEIDIAAPGVNIVSTLPNHTNDTGLKNYGIMSGTSMAAPFVSGVAALVKAQNPELSPAEVKQRLQASAYDLGTPGFDQMYGAGAVNALRALGGTSSGLMKKLKGDNLEDNNSYLTAKNLESSLPLNANIYPDNDVDWYKLSLPAGSQGTIDFTSPAGVNDEIYVFESVVPTYKLLYNSSGTAKYEVGSSSSSRVYYMAVLNSSGNGSSENYTLSFTPKRTAPIIQIKGISEGAAYNQDVQPQILVDNGTFEASLNGNTYSPGQAITAEGSYKLSVKAVNEYGDTTEASVNFTIDKTVPVLTVSGVANGQLYNSTVTPQITTNEGTLTVLLNGNPYNPGSPIAGDGSYRIDAQASDRAGNITRITLTFSIDAAGPKLEPKTTYYSYLVSPSVPIRFSSNEYGRAGIKIYDSRWRLVRDLPYSLNISPGENTYYWDRKNNRGTRLFSGVYYAAVYGFDSSGNPSNTINSTIIFDSSRPAISTYVKYSSFKASSGTQARIRLGEASYLSAGIYDSKGRLVKQLTSSEYRNSGYSYYYWDGRNSSGQLVPAGSYYLKVYANDMAGNSSSSSYRLRVK